MAVIALAGNTIGCCIGVGSFENIGSSFTSAKQSVGTLAQGLSSLKSKIDTARVAASVDTSHTQAENAEKREEIKKSSLTTGYDKLETLITDVDAVDTKSAHKIRERKNDFYSRYSYLKPDCEKTKKELRAEQRRAFWNGVKDTVCNFVTGVVEWCKENWELILAVVVAVVIVVVSIATFGATAVLLTAAIGALVGVAGQLAGDLIATGINWIKTGNLEWKGGDFRDYFAAAIGGAVGGVLSLSCGPMVTCAFTSGFTTYFGGHFKNATGGENGVKKSSEEILFSTFVDATIAVVCAKGSDKLGKSLSKFAPFKRLAGRGSYGASYDMVKTKLSNGIIKNFTSKTVRNGIISEMAGSTFENLTNGVVKGLGYDDVADVFKHVQISIIPKTVEI